MHVVVTELKSPPGERGSKTHEPAFIDLLLRVVLLQRLAEVSGVALVVSKDPLVAGWAEPLSFVLAIRHGQLREIDEPSAFVSIGNIALVAKTRPDMTVHKWAGLIAQMAVAVGHSRVPKPELHVRLRAFYRET
jgi:hypothetical protein